MFEISEESADAIAVEAIDTIADELQRLALSGGEEYPINVKQALEDVVRSMSRQLGL